MKTLVRWLLRLALLVVVIGIGLFFGRHYLILHVAGWIGAFRDPVGPTQTVNWLAGPAQAELPPAQRPPNVLVILADDLGYNDLSYYGGGIAQGSAPTPSIDSIAHEGVNIANGYSGNATCAPSRAMLMTGRYGTRFGFEFTPAPVQFSKVIASWQSDSPMPPIYHAEQEKNMPELATQGMPPSEITIAELLKTRGYHNLMLGKWHLGGTPAMQPEAQGFDEWLGFVNGAAMFLPEDDPRVVNSKQSFDPIDAFLWPNLPYSVRYNGGKSFKPDGYMTDYLTDQAVSAIKANRNRPFFMYLSYNAVHTPLQALKSDYDALPNISNHTERVYAAMLVALDRNIGKLLATLREQGLEDNTLVVFSSDNGGAHYVGLPEINKPFRGWKATFFEGGMHVPFFMKWPARIAKGAQYRAPVSQMDLFSTVAAAAGAALPADRPIDGVDLMPYLSGSNPGQPHDALFFRSGPYQVVIAGGWKLQVTEHPKKNWLYKLDDDPTEQNNLADANAAKLGELMALLKAHNAQQQPPSWPSLLEAAIRIDKPMNQPWSAEDEYIYWSN